jgi:hypothetical protein
MAMDIGVILFTEILGMNMYPGAPFTGDIARDIIMFLVVPTVFIIMILYTMTGRLVADKRIRIMVGVTAYLFIVAGRYYSAFALFAGPYFLLLIFILGLLYFLLGHFKSRPSGGGYSSSGGGFQENRGRYKTFSLPSLDKGREDWLKRHLASVNKDIEQKEKSLHVLRSSGSTHGIGDIEQQLTALKKQRDDYEDELQGRI